MRTNMLLYFALSFLTSGNSQPTIVPAPMTITPAQVTACFKSSVSPLASLYFQTDADPTNYNLFRLGSNARSNDYFPGAVVHILTEKDIIASVRCAASLNMQITAKAGGNSYEIGYVTSAGMLLNFEDYNAVTTNLEDPVPTVTIQIGARIAKLQGVLMNASLSASKRSVFVLSTSNDPFVGAGGQLLCGGFGQYGRKLGLLSDQVSQFTLVNSSGAVITANAVTNPNIFWALRGSCSSAFGIVSTVTLALHVEPMNLGTDAATVTKISFPIPLASRSDVLYWAMFNAPFFPEECSIQYDVVAGKLYCNYLGLKVAALATTWSNSNGPSFSSLASLLGISDGTKQYTEMSIINAIQSDFGLTVSQMMGINRKATSTVAARSWVSQFLFTSVPPSSLADTIVAALESGQVKGLQFNARNGALDHNLGINNVDGNLYTDSALGPSIRGSIFDIEVTQSTVQANLDSTALNNLANFGTMIGAYQAGSFADASYPLFEGPGQQDYFGTYNKAKLASLRQSIDPNNVFSNRMTFNLYPITADNAFLAQDQPTTAAPGTITYAYNAIGCYSAYQNVCTIPQLQALHCVSKKLGCGTGPNYCNSQALWTYSCNLAATGGSGSNYFSGSQVNAGSLTCTAASVLVNCGPGYECPYGVCQQVAIISTAAPSVSVTTTLNPATASPSQSLSGLVGVGTVIVIIFALVVYSRYRRDWTIFHKTKEINFDKKLNHSHATAKTPQVNKMADGVAASSPARFRLKTPKLSSTPKI